MVCADEKRFLSALFVSSPVAASSSKLPSAGAGIGTDTIAAANSTWDAQGSMPVALWILIYEYTTRRMTAR